MLGSETVAKLKIKGHDITVLHRGTWYWDSVLRIKPWVNFIQCDREQIDNCADKLGDIAREKGMFDLVIDFSGYKPSNIKVKQKSFVFGQYQFVDCLEIIWAKLVLSAL